MNRPFLMKSARRRRRCVQLATLSVTSLVVFAAHSQDGEPAISPVSAGNDRAAAITMLNPITVTSTQIERPLFEVPASVDLIEGSAMRDAQMQVNLSEGLQAVPGMLIQNRQNYAQDLQVSLRGFGSRSTFGIRGVRIYVDGIPATMPDGQGQSSNIDIASIDRVEVLRGPFSALYGNSSGGVIQVFTEEGSGPPRLTSSVAVGSDKQRRYGLKAAGSSGDGPGTLDYVLSASRFTTDGYRDHSAARKNLANAKLGLRLDDDSKLTLIVNSVDLKADDPLGLGRDQFNDDPRSVVQSAYNFNTRKTVRQSQGGLLYERRIDADNEFRLMTYYGQRDTEQFLSIPVSRQLEEPSHSGGVVSLARKYGGADARWTSRFSLANRPFTLIGGLAYDAMQEDRKGYENFIGTGDGQRLGVKGALRREETNDLWNIDPYLQASWEFADKWTLDAGVRYSTVRFDSNDDYVTEGNADDSGDARYEKALPMAALKYQATPDLNLYVTAGRGFETPTFNEISYRPDGAAGLNFGLQPSVNTSVEAGAKARVGEGLLTAAVFQTRTRDEIVSAGSTNGRGTFQNAGRTRRNGFELGWAGKMARNWHSQLAYTWLDAKYRDGFCSGVCDSSSDIVPAGNRIPGIARNALYGALAWAPPEGWRAGVEGRYLSKIYVNDSNDEASSGYFTASMHIGYLWQGDNWQWNTFARVDNIFDKRYAGSVIVNEGNGRYFEPAPGRTWGAGVEVSYQF